MKKLFIPPVFVFICLFLIIFFYCVFPRFNYIPFPVNLIGIIITFGGFSLMGQSWQLFNKYKTTLQFKTSIFFITEGVFSKTRNPMYAGMFFILLGAGVCFMNVFSVLTSFGFFLLVHFVFIPKEEKMMVQTFGDRYLEYKLKVKRWI